MTKVNWNEVKVDYVTGGASYAELARKYEVPFSTLARRAKVGGWRMEKARYTEGIVSQALDKITETAANELTRLRGVADRLTGVIGQAVDDPVQFRRYIISCKGSESAEQIFGKLDTKSLKEMTAALKDIQGILDDYRGGGDEDGGTGVVMLPDKGREIANEHIQSIEH